MKERSRAYPGISLGEAINRLEKLNKRLGASGSHDRTQVATGIGYTGLNGRSARAIGALVHYGLLDRKKDLYSLSSLAATILFPQRDDKSDRAEAIRQAVRKPILFAELIDEYQGKELPELLGNILVPRGISPKVKEEVASIFRSSLEFADVIHGNKLLAYQSAQGRLDQENDDDESKIETTELGQELPIGLAAARPLPSGIVVMFPSDLDPYVSLGDFGQALKSLESKAAEIREGNDEESGIAKT